MLISSIPPGTQEITACFPLQEKRKQDASRESRRLQFAEGKLKICRDLVSREISLNQCAAHHMYPTHTAFMTAISCRNNSPPSNQDVLQKPV